MMKIDEKIPEGYKKTKVGVIPDDWKVKKISDIANVTSGGTPSRSKPEYWDGDIPWVTTGEIAFNIISDTAQKITENGLNNSSAKIFSKNTVLMAMYGQGKTRGQVAKLGVEAATNQACAAIAFHKGAVVNFYYQYLISQYESIREIGNAGTQKNLNGALVKALLTPLPPLADQEKIAGVLSKWDEGIEKTEKLIALKEKRKKALMQQLLTGKKRFPRFAQKGEVQDAKGENDYPSDWTETRIKELLVESRTPGTDGLRARKITVKLYGRGVFEKEEKTKGSINTKYFIRQKGQFIYSKLDFLNGAFGIIPDNLDGLETTLDLPCFDFTDKIVPNFLLAYVSREEFYSRFLGAAIGGRKARRISPSEFLAIKLPLPSLKEQKAIAKVLDCADKEINTLKFKLAELKNQKKGLMQQLLTGKTRVVV